jgi:hypothetical protein
MRPRGAFCVRKVSPGRYSEVRGAIGRRRNSQGDHVSAAKAVHDPKEGEFDVRGTMPWGCVIGRRPRAARRVTRDMLAEYRKQRRDRPLAGPDVLLDLGLQNAGTQGSEFTPSTMVEPVT